jgi:hypothetical protein
MGQTPKCWGSGATTTTTTTTHMNLVVITCVHICNLWDSDVFTLIACGMQRPHKNKTWGCDRLKVCAQVALATRINKAITRVSTPGHSRPGSRTWLGVVVVSRQNTGAVMHTKRNIPQPRGTIHGWALLESCALDKRNFPTCCPLQIC